MHFASCPVNQHSQVGFVRKGGIFAILLKETIVLSLVPNERSPNSFRGVVYCAVQSLPHVFPGLVQLV